MILDDITAAVKKRLVLDKKRVAPGEMKRLAQMADADRSFPFEQALSQPGLSVIGEVKRASPSKGIIASFFPYVEIAKAYEQAGITAISVLTERDYFQGAPRCLQHIAETVSIPVLRKDFIVDEYQIYEAKVLGASAILLICAILSDDQLRAYAALADQLGLSALVEAHDEGEVKRALACGARVVGVNNRNLKDFTVELATSCSLRRLVPPGVIFVAESGIKTNEDIQRLKQHGVDAVLIGETFMRSPDKAQALKQLLGE
jgi:indole-3-glycerol phosphate synthase